MARSHIRTPQRRASRGATQGSLPWVSEIQLDAYLQARDALRRARAAALGAALPNPPAPRPPAP